MIFNRGLYFYYFFLDWLQVLFIAVLSITTIILQFYDRMLALFTPNQPRLPAPANVRHNPHQPPPANPAVCHSSRKRRVPDRYG